MGLAPLHVRVSVCLALAVFASAVVLATRQSAYAGPDCSVDASIGSEERDFFRLINDHRQQQGLGVLTLSHSLNRAAAWKAQNMAAENYFAHDDTPLGRSWDKRIRDCGYGFNTYLGENLAAGNASATDAFRQWRNSPGHNANMLSPRFRAIGIGRAYDAHSSSRWYWAIDFGGHVEVSIAGGDVNCDGAVSAVDATLILQRSASIVSALPCAGQADVDLSGNLTAIDAELVLQYTARLAR